MKTITDYQIVDYGIENETEDLPEQPANNALSAWEHHCQNCEQVGHDNCESELYYYVGLRWNKGE